MLIDDYICKYNVNILTAIMLIKYIGNIGISCWWDF